MDARRGTRGLGRSLPRTTLVWVAVAVVALIVVDVVLVSLALGRTATAQNGPAGPIPTFSSSARPSGTPTPSASATPSAGAADDASASRLLSAVDGKEAWRASRTSCSAGKAVLEHSVDGGATWVAVALGDDVRALTGLRATTTGVSVLVGVGDDCAATVRTSADDGATWAAGQPGGAGAGVTDTALQLKSGRIASPCTDPVDAYQGQYTTLVACSDSVAWRSGTGAWVTAPIAGIQSIADAGNTYTLARTGAATCAGVEVLSLPAVKVTASSAVSPVGCWTEGTSSGSVAIDLAGTSLWAWAGDTVAVSADGGASW
ncbi:hypothetical protein ACLBWP_09580 [Microbacterium sp. M1A1_1b]